MSWVSFKLINKEDHRVYIAGELDVDTVDDDEPEYTFEQNDGTFSSHLPTYWKTNSADLTDEFNEFSQSLDWEMLNQYLWDFRNEDVTLNFEGDILIINDGSRKSTTIRVSQETKIKLESIGSKSETFDDIIQRLLQKS